MTSPTLYTPALMGLFQSLLGQSHPLLGGYGSGQQTGPTFAQSPMGYGNSVPPLQAPQNPYGDTQVSVMDQAPSTAQFNAQAVPSGESGQGGGLMASLMSYFQKNPQALQGLMGAMQGPQGQQGQQGAPQQPMPQVGIVQSQPWNSQGHF